MALGESYYRDAFALGSALALRTSTVRLGLGPFFVENRTPFQLAMGTATLEELSGDRVAYLAMGTAHGRRMKQYFGAGPKGGLSRLEDCVRSLKALLSGDGTYHGRFFNFEKFPPLRKDPSKVPVLLADPAHESLRLAGRVADGVILNSVLSAEYQDTVVEMVAASAEASGRRRSEVTICRNVVYAVGRSLEEAKRAAAEDMVFYASYPEQSEILEQLRGSDQKARVMEARKLFLRGRRQEAISVVDDQTLDEFVIHGTPDECRMKLKRFHRDVDALILRVPVSTYPETDRAGVILTAIGSLSGGRHGRGFRR